MMKKVTDTWGERLAAEARKVAARHAPPARAVAWLESYVRRIAPGPSPTKRFARVEPGAKRAPEAALDDGLLIPADVREKLRDVIGVPLDHARVHTGPVADAIAREHRADAVTIGDRILFRDGAYRPHEPRGFALLAHEATHVAAAPAPRATSAGVAAEEARARGVEAAVLAGQRPTTFAAPTAPSFTAAPAPMMPSAVPAARPMTALADRDIAPAATGALDVVELKRTIYRELIQAIRSDAERGG